MEDFDVFQADRDAYQTFAQSEAREFLAAIAGMGHAGRVLRQGLAASEADRAASQSEAVENAPTGCQTAL